MLLAVHAIARLGADMNRHVPKSLDQYHEDCPTFDTPGVISWNFPDPALVERTEQERQRAFNLFATELSTRIRLLLTLLEKQKRASI